MDEIVNFAPGLGNRIESLAYLEKPMTALDKKALSMGIKGLAPQSLVGISDIIIEECPTAEMKLETRMLLKIQHHFHQSEKILMVMMIMIATEA
jgi:hypothetical protein